ncbi:tail fiber assembly protein [Morganella morganii]
MPNTYLFSATENAFYPYELRESYEAAGTWPEKGINVDESVFFEFTQNVPDGKMRGSDKKGNPVWVDVPPLTHEQYVAIAESQKLALTAEVNTETEMLRAKLALGRIKDNEKARLNAWLDYLDELEAVDVSTAPDITWPTKPVV